MPVRKHYSPEFKSKIVLEILREEKSISEISSEYGIHTTQLRRWKKETGVRTSMGGKGRATDNIFTERLWRSLKYEEVYLKEYTSPKEARRGINRYLEFYNHSRPHQSLDYQTPFVA